LLFGLVAFVATCGWAQSDKFGQATDRPATGKADQAEGARILAEFRRAGIGGDYWMAFDLRVMPRKGPERTVKGTMRGSQRDGGPVSRVEIGAERWLVKSGPRAKAWKAGSDGQVMPLAASDTGQALSDTGITVFDLQMPFLYWDEFTYEGEARVRGRATHSFILRAPAGGSLPVPDMTGVRVLIDTQFQAMVQAELLGAKNAALKTISLLDLKKVGEQWLPKSFDVRDARTRDKTRFAVTAAAVELDWPAATFEPAALGDDAPAVPPAKIVRF
jgi:hypothetical protein